MIANINYLNKYPRVNPGVETESDERRKQREKHNDSEIETVSDKLRDNQKYLKDEQTPRISLEDRGKILNLGVMGIDVNSIHTNVGNHINVEA